MNFLYPTLDQILFAQSESIRLHGGSHGLRDRGLLESALAQPRATFGGLELYPTLEEKASAVAFSLAKNHAFIDGNKRIALAALDLFLRANGFRIVASADEIVETILAVASGAMPREAFTDWVRSHIRPLP
jgi:death-on-curing protein